jgi:putative transposase
VFDRCANGQRLTCLTVTDKFTEEGLAIDVGARLRFSRVIKVLSQLVSQRGASAFLRAGSPSKASTPRRLTPANPGRTVSVKASTASSAMNAH